MNWLTRLLRKRRRTRARIGAGYRFGSSMGPRRWGPSRPWRRRRHPLSRRDPLATSFVLFCGIVALGVALVFVAGRPQRPPFGSAPVIAVWNARAASVHEFSLEEYVRGVVAAELPSNFHTEALKAQAVAARTYALRRIEGDARLAQFGGAHVSSDFQVHQAWVDEAAYVAARPGTGEAQWRRIAEAVEATRGLVLTYGGELIDALYHSTSGGHTEDAARYFVGGQPYLRAMPDPHGDHSPAHRTRTVLPLDVVAERLGVSVPAGGSGSPAAGPGAGIGAASAVGSGSATRSGSAARSGPSAGAGSAVEAGPGPGADFIRVLSRTDAGRAERVAVGEREFSGRDIREALGLRSNWFDVAVVGDEVVFDVKGNGHGVGMPQYGADGMARAGHTFEKILAYYYPGTALERRY